MATDIGNFSYPRPGFPHSQGWNLSFSQQLMGLTNWSAWQYVVTFVLGLVVYDQCNHEYCFLFSCHPANTVLVMYLKRKGSIPGPAFKIPLTGPFIQALYPKFEAYLEQWASGPLSCVSIFHKYVLLTLSPLLVVY